VHWHAFANVNKSRELDRLVEQLEDLLARLPEDPSPEISALREKVDRTILATWLGLGAEPAQGAAHIRHHRRTVMIVAVLFVGIVAGALVRRML
jgi:hypothetical protein